MASEKIITIEIPNNDGSQTCEMVNVQMSSNVPNSISQYSIKFTHKGKTYVANPSKEEFKLFEKQKPQIKTCQYKGKKITFYESGSKDEYKLLYAITKSPDGQLIKGSTSFNIIDDAEMIREDRISIKWSELWEDRARYNHLYFHSPGIIDRSKATEGRTNIVQYNIGEKNERASTILSGFIKSNDLNSTVTDVFEGFKLVNPPVSGFVNMNVDVGKTNIIHVYAMYRSGGWFEAKLN